MAIECLESILFHRRTTLANPIAPPPHPSQASSRTELAASYYRDCVAEQFVILPRKPQLKF